MCVGGQRWGREISPLDVEMDEAQELAKAGGRMRGEITVNTVLCEPPACTSVNPRLQRQSRIEQTILQFTDSNLTNLQLKTSVEEK